MKRTSMTSSRGLQSAAEAVNRRYELRPSVEFELMYSTQEYGGEVCMGDGMVTDLSPKGLGIRGYVSTSVGKELTIFLYIPDGQDSLSVTEAKVAWVSGHRFGVEILEMNLRERNRLRYFLHSKAAHSLRRTKIDKYQLYSQPTDAEV
jgi:hypothetical protein